MLQTFFMSVAPLPDAPGSYCRQAEKAMAPIASISVAIRVTNGIHGLRRT
jgi:hypothetical protein